MTASPLTGKEKKARSIALCARIAEIIARGFNRGEFRQIAREFGVTRQYVSYLKSHFTAENYTPNTKGGYRRERPFSERERQAFAFVLRGRPPVKGAPLRRATIFAQLEKLQKQSQAAPAVNTKTTLWTLSQAQTWFARTFARQAKFWQVKAFAKELGITFAEEHKTNTKNISETWAKHLLTDEFRHWQASPQAAKLREREAALKLVFAERLKNTPLKRKSGRPKKSDLGASFDAPLSGKSPYSVATPPERNRKKAGWETESEADSKSRLFSHDECPLDNSREFGRCCGVTNKYHCLKVNATSAAGAGD
jgi:transposase